MSEKKEKPSAAAKALSLYLMAYKATSPVIKEKAKRLNRQWDLVVSNEITKEEYLEQVNATIESYGGYLAIIEKTVKFYIEKTGKWTLKGDDKYCTDAKVIADKLLKK